MMRIKTSNLLTIGSIATVVMAISALDNYQLSAVGAHSARLQDVLTIITVTSGAIAVLTLIGSIVIDTLRGDEQVTMTYEEKLDRDWKIDQAVAYYYGTLAASGDDDDDMSIV